MPTSYSLIFTRSCRTTQHTRLAYARTCLCACMQPSLDPASTPCSSNLSPPRRPLQSESPATNPFLPVFLEQVSRAELAPCERDFLRNLLCYPPKDLPKKSPRELLVQGPSSAPEPGIQRLGKECEGEEGKGSSRGWEKGRGWGQE